MTLDCTPPGVATHSPGPSADVLLALVKERVDDLRLRRSFRRLLPHLEGLRLHSLPTFSHSLRVGWYASMLAPPVQRRLALLGGCAHDVGKLSVPAEVLHAEVFGPAERSAVRVHARSGFERLANHLPLTAVVAGLHHTFQDDPYGITVEEATFDVPEDLRSIVLETTALVAMCDFYDALTTRRNDRGLVSDPGDRSEVEALMRRHFPDRRELPHLLELDLCSIQG